MAVRQVLKIFLSSLQSPSSSGLVEVGLLVSNIYTYLTETRVLILRGIMM